MRRNEFLLDLRNVRNEDLTLLAGMLIGCARWPVDPPAMAATLEQFAKGLAAARRRRRGRPRTMRIWPSGRLTAEDRIVLAGSLRRWAGLFEKIEAVASCLEGMAQGIEDSLPAGEKKSRKRTTGGR